MRINVNRRAFLCSLTLPAFANAGNLLESIFHTPTPYDEYTTYDGKCTFNDPNLTIKFESKIGNEWCSFFGLDYQFVKKQIGNFIYIRNIGIQNDTLRNIFNDKTTTKLPLTRFTITYYSEYVTVGNMVHLQEISDFKYFENLYLVNHYRNEDDLWNTLLYTKESIDG